MEDGHRDWEQDEPVFCDNCGSQDWDSCCAPGSVVQEVENNPEAAQKYMWTTWCTTCGNAREL